MFSAAQVRAEFSIAVAVTDELPDPLPSSLHKPVSRSPDILLLEI
jgi:hypothetical protein